MAQRAVLYVPARRGSGVAWAWLDLCAEYCAHRGYQVTAAVVDGRWDDAVAMVTAGEADVVVIGRWEHMPARVLGVEAALTWGESSDR